VRLIDNLHTVDRVLENKYLLVLPDRGNLKHNLVFYRKWMYE